MKKLFTLLMLGTGMLSAQAQYQVQNSNFEEWEDVAYNKTTGKEPIHWSSFLNGSGGLQTAAAAEQLFKYTTEVRPGSAGKTCAKITCRFINYVVVKAYAQGNLTTGCINMGSSSASDAGKSASDNNSRRGKESIANGTGNYNWTDVNDDSHNQKFTGRPDAMHVWVKFYSSNTNYRAKATSVLHTEGYYQDPLPKTNDCSAKLVATASNVEIAPDANKWQELTIPFVYEDGNLTPAYALVTFSTNATPGTGTADDYMLIDDLEMLYYSELASAKYDGNEVSFNGTSATVDALYDESKLALTSNGAGATIEKSYDEVTAVLTITVKGDNISEDANNKHVYTIQFKKPVSELVVPVSFNTKYDYITFCAPFDTQTPHSGYVDSYTVDGLEDNGATLVLTHVTGNGEILPAHTPVLLKNSYYETATHELRGFPTEGTPKAGLLTGTYEDIKAPKGSYVLQYQNETLGFYKVEDVQPTVKAYRAYLNVDSNVKGFGFSTENGATAIKALEALTSGKPEIYDLNGRKLNKLQKGVNIVNGVKVLVK